MKILRMMLLAGGLAAMGLSTAWAAEGGREEPTTDADTAEVAAQSAEPQPKRPARRQIVDIAAETASHEEIEPLAIEFGRLSALRLDGWGRLLAGDEEAREIKVISAYGRQIGTFKPGFAPEAIDVARNGTIYCGGEGKLAVLDPCGNVRRRVSIPDDAATSISSRRRGMSRPLRVSGIAVSGRDVFVAFGSGWSMGSKSKLYRFDRCLRNPQLLAEGLRGCCQRCDIATARGVLYLAENAAHRVVLYDRDGEVLDKWGTRSRTDIKGFGACCNPMNLFVDGRGVLYTAESGIGRVKRYTPDGEYLGLVGYVGVERFTSAGRLAASCSNIAIAVTPNGGRVYLMDLKNNLIRVLQKKKEKDDFPTVRRKGRVRILGRPFHGGRRAGRRR